MTGIFIIARLGSTRLPDKHLIAAGGRTFVDWEVSRIKRAFADEIKNGTVRIIICTADEKVNRRFSEMTSEGVSVYFGNVHNIPVRIYECAVQNEIDEIAIVDGDDVLVSMRAVKEVYEALKNGHSLVKTLGLPLGMNAFGFHSSELSMVHPLVRDKDILETGWGRFFDESHYLEIEFPHDDNTNILRFTLDYPEDEALFTRIFEHFQSNIFEATDKDVIDFVIENQLYKLNAAIHKEYWDNFYRQVEDENAR